MGQLKFRPRTLDDDIIKEGLCAVGTLENFLQSKKMCFVVGGIATQSYFPTVFRRPTSDIDLAVLRPLNFEEFKDFASPAIEYLRDKRYDVKAKKGHLSHQILFSNEDEGTKAVIEFPRRNGDNYIKRQERLEREMENTRIKIIEDRSQAYRVSSPEDIIVPKLVRGVNSLSRNPDFCAFVE